MDDATFLAKAGAPRLLDGERFRFSAELLKVTGRNRQLTARVLVLTERSMVDVHVKGGTLKVLHRVPLEDLSGYSVDGQMFIVHVDRRSNATKDFLLVSPNQEAVCGQLAAAYNERVRRQLRRRDWDENGAGARVLSQLSSHKQAHSVASGQRDGVANTQVAPRSDQLVAMVSEFSAYEWTAEACDAYAFEQFNTRRKEDVQEHCQQLQHVKAHAASQLQQSVVEHYRSFIRTSNETAEVDEDLSHLRKQLVALKKTIGTLRESTFDFSVDVGNEGAAHKDSALLPTESSETWGESGQDRLRQCRSLLATVEQFAALKPQQVQRLLGTMETKVFREGEVIIREAEPVDQLVIVEHGECARRTRARGTIIVQRLRRGQCFGNTELLSEKATRHTVVSDATIAAHGGVCKVICFPLPKFDATAEVNLPQAFWYQYSLRAIVDTCGLCADARRSAIWTSQTIWWRIP